MLYHRHLHCQHKPVPLFTYQELTSSILKCFRTALCSSPSSSSSFHYWTRKMSSCIEKWIKCNDVIPTRYGDIVSERMKNKTLIHKITGCANQFNSHVNFFHNFDVWLYRNSCSAQNNIRSQKPENI